MPKKTSRGMDVSELKRIQQEVETADPITIQNRILGDGDTDFERGIIDGPEQPDETFSPFNTEVKGPSKLAVEEIHQNRSERAQDVDEQRNAPITTDEKKWIENKNRYDYPGVDTIPESRQRKRAERAAQVAKESGAADRVEERGSEPGFQGKFSPSTNETFGKGENVVRVQEVAKNKERILAHEVGHAFDFAATGDAKTAPGPEGNEVVVERIKDYKMSDLLFEGDNSNTEKIRQEAVNLSKRARGEFGQSEEYRGDERELTADALAQTFIEPSAAKREAPNLFDRITDIAEEEGFAEAIPDPLESDPEPMGFLK